MAANNKKEITAPERGRVIVLMAVIGGVAQLGEHLPCKQGVKSSNLSISIWTIDVQNDVCEANVEANVVL